METSAMIDGYRVDLEIDAGEGVSSCFVSKKCPAESGHVEDCSASLALLEDGGYLCDSRGNDIEPVPAHIVRRISKWAEQNGY